MTHQEFDQLMNSYFDGNIEEQERSLLFAELERNADRRKLFDRLSSIYQKTDNENIPQADQLLNEVALSSKIKPSGKDDEIIEKAASGSLFSGVNTDASRSWKGYAEDNYTGRIVAILITALVLLTLFIVDRQWAKSIEEKKKLGVVQPSDEVADSTLITPEKNFFDQIERRQESLDSDFTMGSDKQHFFVDDKGLVLGIFRRSLGGLNAEYVQRRIDLDTMTDQIAQETGSYIYNIQKNSFLINNDIKTYSHTIILGI